MPERRVKPAPMLWISIMISIVLAGLKWVGLIAVSWWFIPYPPLCYLAALAVGIMIFSNAGLLYDLAKSRKPNN